MLKSTATLKERLAGWLPWDEAMYQVGACLGFWPEFGAPHDHDPWNHVKDVMHTNKHELGAILEWFLKDLAEEGCLEEKAVDVKGIPTAYYRWNPNYKGKADVITTL
jgi:hypothetical protein